jgi:hypothetical protein
MIPKTARALLLFSLCGCELALDFDRSRLTEDSAELCSDGLDNDGDGLTDCQDFKCLGKDPCCDLPTVVLADSFDGATCAAQSCTAPAPAACAPDPARWSPWGSPQPLLCENALAPHKVEQCYDVGVIGKQSFLLRPGLIVTAGVIGRPEAKGRLIVGLTLHDEIAGNLDPCTPIDDPEPVISVAVLADTGGYRLVARFGTADVAASALVTDLARHEVGISVGSDRRIDYLLDGVAFARSSEAQTAPSPEVALRLELAGRGLDASFTDAQVVVGMLCETPDKWATATPFVALDASSTAAQWDALSVWGPTVVRTPSGELDLYYSGCRDADGRCDPYVAGAGRAVLPVGGSDFSRDPTCPLVAPQGYECGGALADPLFTGTIGTQANVDLPPWIGLDGRWYAFLSIPTGGDQLLPLESDDGKNFAVSTARQPIHAGGAGAWDHGGVCCASVVEDDNGITVWFAGRASAAAPWQIGSAHSGDGMTFEEHVGPVLGAGEPGDFDGAGARSPHVLYDARRGLYRMWYQGLGPLGTSSIGYAVSPDGVSWHKFPGNPVITPEALGLLSVDAPFVIDDQGALRMWLDGATSDRRGQRIFALTNGGQPLGAP